MAPAILFFLYLGVMGAAFVCFLAAYRARFDTPRHKRWAVTGVALAVAGVLVVLLGANVWGWEVRVRWPSVVYWHRRLAYVAFGLVLLTALTGALRLAVHKRLYVLLLPAYALVLLLAVLGYAP